MNADLGMRLARLEAAMPAAALAANRLLLLAACQQLRPTIGVPLLTAAGCAAYAMRPPLDPARGHLLLSRLLEALGTR